MHNIRRGTLILTLGFAIAVFPFIGKVLVGGAILLIVLVG